VRVEFALEQPAAASGYWEKVIDLETILPGSRVSLTPNITVLAGDPDYTVDISVSEDGVDWTDFEDTLEVFVSAFQYVKVRVTIATDSPETGMLLINSLRLKISLTKKTDSGSIEALSTDTDGTVVAFNEDFIDVNSIVLTPEGPDYATAVKIFTDAPYPTEFKVKVFDVNGNRITRDVAWLASGV